MKKLNFQDLIISETDDYIIINKPPFISTLEDRTNPNNILKLSKSYWDKSQVCHRLDKETSGVMAIAKNPKAYSHLSVQFEKRTVKKTYEAVVDGLHNFKNDRIDAPITAMTNGVVKIDNRYGKKATTVLTTTEAFRRHTLVECQPETGRMHQIRIHLALVNAPIVGDKQYGGRHLYLSSLKPKFNLKKDTEELPLIKRVALHAKTLEFKDLSGHKVSFSAPYPKDFAVLLKQLKAYI